MARIIHRYNQEEGTYVICIDEATGREKRIEQDAWRILREEHGDVLLEDPFSVLTDGDEVSS